MDDRELTKRVAWHLGLEPVEIDGVLMARGPDGITRAFAPLDDNGDCFKARALAGVSIDDRPGSIGATARHGRGPAVRLECMPKADRLKVTRRVVCMAIYAAGDGC